MDVNMLVCLPDVIATFLPYNVHNMQIRKLVDEVIELQLITTKNKQKRTSLDDQLDLLRSGKFYINCFFFFFFLDTCFKLFAAILSFDHKMLLW